MSRSSSSSSSSNSGAWPNRGRHCCLQSLAWPCSACCCRPQQAQLLGWAMLAALRLQLWQPQHLFHRTWQATTSGNKCWLCPSSCNGSSKSSSSSSGRSSSGSRGGQYQRCGRCQVQCQLQPQVQGSDHQRPASLLLLQLSSLHKRTMLSTRTPTPSTWACTALRLRQRLRTSCWSWCDR